jgi:heat shock protein HtpX
MRTAALLAALAAVLIFIGGAFAGETGVVIAFLFALVFNAFSYWFSDKIVLRMHGATEVGQDHVLYRVTQRLAQKANLPMPRVYLIPSMSPNAFATGRNEHHAAVAATEGLLRLLSESELEGVIAHELAHVKHHDILISSIAATLAAAILSLVRIAQFGAFFGGSSRNDGRGSNPIALLAMIILAPLAAMLIQAAISRNREFGADRGGADIAGTPMGLANALRKLEVGAKEIPLGTSPAVAHMYIVKPFMEGGWTNLFSSHPPTEARIQALMEYRAGR